MATKIPKEMYDIMTSNDDIYDQDNSRKNNQFAKLFKTRADCKKLAQNKKFWIAKLKADYNIDFDKLDSTNPFSEYVNFSRITDGGFAWYFIFEGGFGAQGVGKSLAWRRAATLAQIVTFYIKLKEADVALAPICETKIELTAESMSIQIQAADRQTIPAGKIIKALNNLQMGTWWMPIATVNFNKLYDKVYTADVTFVNHGSDYKNITVFECKPYYICATPSGAALCVSDDLNIVNVKMVTDRGINI